MPDLKNITERKICTEPLTGRKSRQSGFITKERMTALPFLPSKVIEKIAAFLPLPDVCNCMLVCKEWKLT
ncbi:hypothetical protein ACROYT_G039036 [Oculina patagonica]